MDVNISFASESKILSHEQKEDQNGLSHFRLNMGERNFVLMYFSFKCSCKHPTPTSQSSHGYVHVCLYKVLAREGDEIFFIPEVVFLFKESLFYGW